MGTTATTMVRFERPDGGACHGWYAGAEAEDRAPGVVVIQEWWGLNEQIKGVAGRLAGLGYRVLVPDLFRGKVTLDEAEANHLMTNLDFVDAATQDIRGAVRHLKEASPRVAVLGFCMGGALAVLAAVHTPEADAVCTWYGCPPLELVDAARLRGKAFQGHFANRDDFFPPDQIDGLEAKLRDAGVEGDFFRYHAAHAFGNETGASHDPGAAREAWARTTAFLARALRHAGAGDPAPGRASR